MSSRWILSCVLVVAGAAQAGPPGVKGRPGPLSDLPPDHAAHRILAAALRSGAWPETERGHAPDPSRTLTRFEVARTVAILMDTWTDPTTRRRFTARDVANLESLAAEFSAEMPLVSGRLSRIEGRLDELNRDVESLRGRHRRNRWP